MAMAGPVADGLRYDHGFSRRIHGSCVHRRQSV